MKKITRRAAITSVAATAVAGIGTTSVAQTLSTTPSEPEHSGQSMTLDEFLQSSSPVTAQELLHPIEGHAFSKCHEDMRERHGIWIPELVPVFEKLDAMRAHSPTS